MASVATLETDFGEKRFAAEQKKYELGVIQLFFVLDAQTQLNLAENDVLRQSINYRRGLINLHLMRAICWRSGASRSPDRSVTELRKILCI